MTPTHAPHSPELGKKRPVVIFIPGFATPASAYSSLLAPLRNFARVVTTDRPRLASVTGRYRIDDEVADVQALITHVRTKQNRGGVATDLPVVLIGHSRGGQVAWRVAGQRPDVHVCAIDPVDGNGPRSASTIGEAVSQPQHATLIGFANDSRCAPARLNFQVFAQACPTATVIRFPDFGHADILDPTARRVAQALCPAGRDAASAINTVSSVLVRCVREAGAPPAA